MKTTIRLLLALLIMSNIAHSDWDLHVAADAIAGGNESESRPFRCLIEARDVIRTRRIDRPSDAVRVLVGADRYEITNR